MTLDVLLLSAGYGTRLRPLTEEAPKALLPFYGVPLLDLHLDRLTRSRPPGPRFGGIVVNTHHLADHIAAHLAPRVARGEVMLSPEEEILGTGGAIARAAPHLRSDPFLVLNCDSLSPLPPPAALAFHRRQQVEATLLLTPSPLHTNVLCEGGRVRAIQRGRPDAHGYTYTGCCLLSRAVLARIPPQGYVDIRDVFDALIDGGWLGGWIAPDDPPLLDLGTPARYLDAHRTCPPEALARYGLRLDATRFRRPRGYGFIDAGATTEEGSQLRDSLVLSGARIGGGARVERSIVGPGVSVDGPVTDRLITRRGSVSLVERRREAGEG